MIKMGLSRRGQVTFTIKALVLVLSVVAFTAIIWQAQNFFGSTVEQKQESQFKMEAMEVLQKLINNENCLAYSYQNTTYKGVIDREKLEKFEENYRGLEPDCANALPFDYNIRVKTLPMNISTHQPLGGFGGGTFGEILDLIDGKKIVFVSDGSASMQNSGGTYKGNPVNKLECSKLFLKSFINRLSKESEVSLIPYYFKPGGQCTHSHLFGYTEISNNREMLEEKIDKIKYYDPGGTPMCKGLEQGLKYAKNNDGDVVVLMTDGCENICCGRYDGCCCNENCESVQIAEKYKNTNLTVMTVGYGKKGVCYRPVLTKIAKLTGGKSFRAKSCEQLLKIIPKTKIELDDREWGKGGNIGVSQFSSGDIRKNSITVSLPVSIRYGFGDYKRAIIYLKAVKGNVEKLSGYLNRICQLGSQKNENIELSMEVSFDNPVKFVDDKEPKICMMGKEKVCKKISCDFEISFENITEAGSYSIRMKYNKNKNEVTVRT